MRVLYLYSGKRKIKKYQGKLGIDYPDTQFYGLNYLKEYGIEAEYQELGDFKYFKFLEKFLSFRTKHFLMFFKIKKYDLVFGSSLIYLMPLKIIFRNKTKFILFNIYLNRLILANKSKFLKYWLIKFLIKKMDRIICPSCIQKKYLINNYNFPKKRISFIPLGVDVNFHRYVPDNQRKDFILSVGSDDGRDYKSVLKTAQLCPNLKFVIVCGQKNMAGIRKKEIPKNVEIFYYISSRKLKQLYQQARIFLMSTYPDRHKKGADCSGQTVLLDVMASGLPMIANKKAYLSDYVENNQEMIITNTNSPLEFKRKIESLLSNNELRINLAKKARKKVSHNFTTKIMAQKLSICFKKTL